MSQSRQVLALALLLLLALLVWVLTVLPDERAEPGARLAQQARSCRLRPAAVIVRPCEETDVEDDDGVDVRAPNVYQVLPHLLQDRRSLRPVLHLGDGAVGDPARRGSAARAASVSLAIGVVGGRGGERAVAFLDHLVAAVTPEERDQTLVVVLLELADFIGLEAIRERFGAEVQSGLIEVISAPDTFYPTYLDGARNHGSARRVLDVSFLMMYSQERAEFYLQLSEESRVARGFVSKMQWFAMELEAKQYWMAINYSEEGFEGNLFLSSELPRIVQFFLMFYNDHKITDLFENLVYAKACRPKMIQDECRNRMNKVWVKHRPTLVRGSSEARSHPAPAAVLV